MSAAVPGPARALLDRLAEDPARSALVLDFDGTLAPIVPHPDDARLIEGASDEIARIRDRLGLVAFVSGRGLADLEARVALPGLAYAGNHGMEIRHPAHEADTAGPVRPWLARIASFAGSEDPDEMRAHGVWIEDKGATLSVHWRGAADPDAAEAYLRGHMASRAERDGFVVTWGRMIMEVRPPVRIHKGTAVRELVTAAGCRRAVYIGDDRTDADAWRELHAMRAEGALDLGAGIAAVAAGDREVPPEVREVADAEVPGPPGALAALVHLAARLG